MKCPIDNEERQKLFAHKVMGKHEVTYHFCRACGLVQTDEPHWLAEAYDSAIASTDLGLVSRNMSNQKNVEAILHCLGQCDSPILDLGGGYGLLCRLLRDRGLDCYTTDLHCENLFAREFSPPAALQAKVLLAFEVLEHIQNPVQFLQEALSHHIADTIIFSTETYAGANPPSPDWYYYCFETGQHVSIYHPRTLEIIADRIGMHYYALSSAFHVFTRTPIPPIKKALLNQENSVMRRLYFTWTKLRRRGQSFLQKDYESAKRSLIESFNRGTAPR